MWHIPREYGIQGGRVHFPRWLPILTDIRARMVVLWTFSGQNLAMADRIFTADERQKFEAQAHRRGFKTLRDYLQSLLRQDAEQHGEAAEVEADDDPVESFKRGWDDAMNGRTMSYEEFERRMREDAD